MERIGSTPAKLFSLTFGLCLISNLLFSAATSDKHQLELAIGYIEQESYPLAIGVLSPLLRKNPSSFLIRYYLGDCYRRQRRYHKASEILSPIFDLSPTELISNQTHVMLAEIYLQLGQLDLAFQQAKSATKTLPNLAESHYYIGKVYLFWRQLDDARSAFIQSIQQNSTFSDAYQELGHIALIQNRTQKAIEHFKKMIDLDPFDHRPHFGLIKVYQQIDNRELANHHQKRFKTLKKYFDQIHDLQMMLVDEPTNVQIRLEIAELHYRNQNLTASLNDYRMITLEQPEIGEAWDQLGRIYMQMGDFETAISAFYRLIQLRPESLETHLRLGWIYTKQQRFEEAKQLLQKAIRLSPSLTLAYHGLAEVHLAEGNSDLALSVYEQIVKLGDCGPDVMITLGQLRIENGQTNEALVAFQTAIKGGRNDSRPYLYIAQIYAETGTYLVNAEKFAQKAVKLNPSSPELATLALVYLRQDKLHLAEATIRQALSKSPDNIHYQKRLDEILQAQKNKTK